MKRVVSVSIGSSTRDSKAIISVCGQEFSIERIGTDGDIDKAVELIKELDGKVAALGMGALIFIYGVAIGVMCCGKQKSWREQLR